MRQSRRALLATAGAACLAGCTGVMGSDESDTDTPDGETEPGTATDSGPGGNPGTTTPDTSGPGTGTEAPGTDAGPGTGTATGTPTETGPTELGSQLEGFEDLEYWYTLSDQGSIEATGDGAYRGPQSLRLRASGDDEFAGAFTAFSEPRNVSGKNLSLAVKVDAPQIAKLSVALLAPDRGNMVRMTRTFPGPQGAWVRSDMGVTTVRGDPDLSSVQEIRLVARRRDQNADEIDVTVDDIRLVDAPDTGYVTFTFDDTHESHYNRAFPMMEEYGFAGVEGVISDAVYRGDRLDVGNMREMADAGWDMASHPKVGSTLLTEYSERRQRQIIRDNKQFLEQKGFRDGARHFLTPKNMVGPTTMELVSEFHESLYTFGGMPNGRPPTTNYYNSRITAANNDTIREYVDNAARFGQHLVLNSHAIGSGGGDLAEDDFRAILDYVDQAEVEVVTCSDVLELQSQG